MDNLTPDQRRKNMQSIRSKDTSLELKLRSALWNEGIRYRKNYNKLPGKPDIAITKYKIAVFCDSSFWHGRNYQEKRPVATNSEYWDEKIIRNLQRDKQVNERLCALGWTVLRFWDDDINNNIDECVETVKDALLESKLAGR